MLEEDPHYIGEKVAIFGKKTISLGNTWGAITLHSLK